MNDTGGGVTAIHDVPGDITRIGFHWMLLFFLSVTRRGASILSSHGVSRRSRGFSLSRICELFLHTEGRGGHGFSLSRICELANCFFTRSVADGCGACSSCEWGLFVVVYRPIRGVCV